MPRSGTLPLPHPGVALAWLAFLALAWGPVAGLAAEAAGRLAAGDADAWAMLWPDGRRMTLLARSAGIALAVALLAWIAGGLAGLAAWRMLARPGWPGWLRLGLAAGLVLWLTAPPYLHALAGMEAGAWLRAVLGIGAGAGTLPGWLSVILVQGFALLPLPLIATMIGLASVERDLVQAAALVAPPARAFRRIWLPLAMPVALAGAGAAFVFSLLDSSTPSLFGLPSYAMEIVAEYGATRTAWRAMLLAMPLILLAGLVIATMLPAVGRTRPAHGLARPADPGDCSPGRATAVAAAVGLAVVAAYGAGILALILAGASLWHSLPALVWETRGDLLRTVMNAALAGALVLVPGMVIAQALLRAGRWRALAWGAVLLPLALPPALSGAGLATIMAAQAPDSLRSLPVIPAIAHAGRFLPLAVLVIHVRMRRIDPLLIDAARILQPPGPARWARIDLPLAAPALLAAFALVFCASMGELEAALMTAAPGAGLLSLRVFNYLHYGVTDTVAALGLVLGLLLWLGAAGTLAAARLRESRQRGGR